MNFRQSGKYYEYKTVEFLEKNGYKAIRIPVSGTGKQPIPDIIAVKNNTIFAIEVKSTSQNYIIVENFQIDKLFKFCEIFNFCNCQPLVIVHYKKYKNVIIYNLSQDDRRKEKVKLKFRNNG
ncbi:Holliday-junction resolvase [Sulfolobus islandicus rod-shaped virus]|nr:Holliday-junction resolvase [Sulfolobus islandicus rod-shaped virus]